MATPEYNKQTDPSRGYRFVRLRPSAARMVDAIRVSEARPTFTDACNVSTYAWSMLTSKQKQEVRRRASEDFEAEG